MRRFTAFMLLLFLAAIASKAASADAHGIDKLRRFYAQHGLDFFGELISGQEDFLEDEKKHAKIELLSDDARSKALAQLDSLLKKATGSMRAELLLRKATLLSDRARTATYFQNNPLKASKLKGPEVYLKASIEVFQSIEHEFAGHPSMDIVTFSIAYNYGELKRPDDAFRYYNRLVQNYPASPLVGDARLALAEIQFDRRRFGDALAQLKEIVRSEHPRLKNFALYKMAWAYYNMSDLDSAVQALERVIDGVNNSSVAHARLELRKEALHDLVAFYAERPDPKGAANATTYFEKIAHTPQAITEEYAAARQKRVQLLSAKGLSLPDEDREEYQVSEPRELLFRLVQVYRDQGKHEPAMVVAGELISVLGRHPRVPALYRLRAESAEKLRRRDLVLAELEKLGSLVEHDLPEVSDYKNGLPETELGSLSEAFQTSKPASVKLAVNPVAPTASQNGEWLYRQQLAKISFEAFNDFSRFLHGEWSKTQGAETARFALSVYDLGVKALFEPWRGQPLEQCLELRSRRAQLRFALKKWDLAAQDFHYLALHVAQPEAHVIEDVRGEIAALEALLKEDKVEKGSKKSALHPLHQRLFAAYDGFLARFLFTKSLRENAAGILVASAQLHHDYGHDAEALLRMEYYSRQFHDQKDAVPATREVLNLLSESQSWKELRDYAASLIELGAYKTTPVAKEIEHSREYASLKLLEALEKSKDWSQAEKEFASFAKENPKSPFVSQALLKSANAALETKDPEAAIGRLESATQAPDAGVQLQAWLALEPFYRKGYQYVRLRALYEAVLKLNPDAKTRASAEQNLKAVIGLQTPEFSVQRTQIAPNDSDLSKLTAALANFENRARAYNALRFVKSNNNPQRNFKQKADLNAKLANDADELAASTAASLKNAALAWATTTKAALLLDFAETFETSALPALLKGATDTDRKSYTDTIATQAKDLRDKAHALAIEAANLLEKIDSPLPLEFALNSVLERVGEPLRLNRQPLAETWSKRPAAGKAKPDALDPAVVRKLGLRIIKATDAGEIRERTFVLAREYERAGAQGFAYATSLDLTGNNAKDEFAARAARLQFNIDMERLPPLLQRAIETSSVSTDERWNVARWLAGLQTKFGVYGEQAFSKDEQEWFASTIKLLLRPVRGEARILQAQADAK